MNRPEIAVVAPTYRRPDRLPRLVKALESQTLAPDRFEIVIVDDGSGDGTDEVLADLAAQSSLPIRIHADGINRGAAGARNAGWRATTAPIVAFFDDDCEPQPEWLEAGLAAMVESPSVGIAQGCTLREPNAALGDWTVWREIVQQSPYFEACNLFVRRDALEAAGGFPEDIGFFGEDTEFGWRVVDAGFDRAFIQRAVAFHDVEERGLKFRVRGGFYERRNLIGVAARHPRFRREAFWRPWAFQRDDAASTLAMLGLVLSLRWRLALLLLVPYLRWRRPPAGHHRYLRLVAERFVVDAALAAGVAAGAVTNRIFVI